MVRASTEMIDQIIIGSMLGLSVDDIGARFDRSRHWVNRVRVSPDFKNREKEIGRFLAHSLPILSTVDAVPYEFEFE